MAYIEPYPSRLGDASSRRFGTFSYLPAFTDEQIRDQIRYILSKGWTCAVEYSEPEYLDCDYWYMWKLPLFGVADVELVMQELRQCRDANPDCFVRLMGYDSRRQTQGLSLVVYRPEGR